MDAARPLITEFELYLPELRRPPIITPPKPIHGLRRATQIGSLTFDIASVTERSAGLSAGAFFEALKVRMAEATPRISTTLANPITAPDPLAMVTHTLPPIMAAIRLRMELTTIQNRVTS